MKSKLLFIGGLAIIIFLAFNFFNSVDENFYDMWSIKSIEYNDKEVLNYFLSSGTNLIIFNRDKTCELPIYLNEYANDEGKGVWTLSGFNRDNLEIKTTSSFFNTTFKVIKFDRLNLILENKAEKKRVVCFRL